MEQAAKDLGYHPFPAPSANMSGVYTNPEGVTLGACEYCGHCERFGCEANAKASPQACILPVLLPDPKFELRTYAYVKELVYDKQAKKVKAVRYVDTRSGEEFEQPAGLIIMGAYVFNNVLLMLTAGIGDPYDHTDRQRRRRQELLLPDQRQRRDGVLREQGDQPVHGVRCARHQYRRLQRRQF